MSAFEDSQAEAAGLLPAPKLPDRNAPHVGGARAYGLDERYAAVHVRDRGIIVFTACSHAGVVNVLMDAREKFDPIPLYGVVGGFHLSGAACEPIIPQTVNDLETFDLSIFVPGHCTGWRALHKLVEAFGEDKVIPSAVGRTYRF